MITERLNNFAAKFEAAQDPETKAEIERVGRHIGESVLGSKGLDLLSGDGELKKLKVAKLVGEVVVNPSKLVSVTKQVIKGLVRDNIPAQTARDISGIIGRKHTQSAEDKSGLPALSDLDNPPVEENGSGLPDLPDLDNPPVEENGSGLPDLPDLDNPPVEENGSGLPDLPDLDSIPIQKRT